MAYNASQAVTNACRDVGWHEIPDGSNINPYSLWQYGVQVNPYCASAVSKWSYDAGFRFWSDCACREKGDYNVTSFRIHAQNHGVWRDPSTVAHPGWLVVESFGIPDEHIELVISDAGGNVATVGANTSNGVYYRTRYRSNIVGFIALDEAGENSAPTPTPASHPTIQMGSQGAAVSECQRKLNGVSGAHLVVDGDFGPATYGAVCGFQTFFKLGTDGIVGPKTWAMLDYCAALKHVS